jgi:hypothetical protein
MSFKDFLAEDFAHSLKIDKVLQTSLERATGYKFKLKVIGNRDDATYNFKHEETGLFVYVEVNGNESIAKPYWTLSMKAPNGKEVKLDDWRTEVDDNFIKKELFSGEVARRIADAIEDELDD